MRSARLALAIVLTASVLAAASLASAAESPREVRYQQLRGADDEVFMQVQATSDQIGRVRSEIEHSSLVHRFAFLDQHDAYTEFQRIFRKDPDLVANVMEASLPTSFRVDLRNQHDRTRFKTRFDRFDGVDEVKVVHTKSERAANKDREAATRARCGVDSPIEVFVPVHATTAEEKAVEAALRATPEVVSVRRIARDEAKEVFDCLFADEPDLTRNVDAASLPVSFRVEVRDGTNLRLLGRTLGSLQGVDQVEVYG